MDETKQNFHRNKIGSRVCLDIQKGLFTDKMKIIFRMRLRTGDFCS